MTNKTWEAFEAESAQYLNDRYAAEYQCAFTQSGGHNSHEPDIYVTKKCSRLFSMETKMSNAQCGQFVLFPDDSNQKFNYSEKNEFPENDFSKAIISEMERDYYKYNKPSTKQIDIDKKFFYQWVINHYKIDRCSKYLITRGHDFVIFNIDKFAKYFDISAVFRVKKSGSSNPNTSDLTEIRELLNAAQIRFSNLCHNGRYVEVNLPNVTIDRFTHKGGKFTYQYKLLENQTYRITKLSNTYNANVIFSISLKREQDEEDLKEFLTDLA